VLPVNKKSLLAAAFILALLFSAVVGRQIINLAEANPNLLKGLYCNISIQSPQNETYNTEPILLNFTVKNNYVSDAYLYFYLLDGQDRQSSVKVKEIQVIGQETISNDTYVPYTEYTLWGQAILPNLSDGPHNLTVFMGWVKEDGVIYHANIDPFSTTAHFSVDTTTPTPSPSPSPQETEPELFSPTWLAVVAIIAIGGAAFTFYYFTKNRKTTIQNEK
jgi:hypothetical protein